MSIKQFVKKNKEFWWYIKDVQSLDESAVVEGVIRYGDMKEVRQLMGILGVQKMARIFAKQSAERRTNYDAQTIFYFKHYFKQYAK